MPEVFLYRFLTAPFRTLPHFIIPGAQKSGTTSLYEYLIQHPMIIEPDKKEIQFFSTWYWLGTTWYKSFFPLKKNFHQNQITGEASPAYILHPHGAKRIHDLVPEVKIIILLRNPVERALSSYFHQVRKKREKYPLREALAMEEERIGKYMKGVSTGNRFRFISNRKFRSFSYKTRGHYAEEIEKFLQYFDSSKILIQSSESFFANPKEVIKKIFLFLSVEPDFTPGDLKPANLNPIADYENIDPDILKDLEEYYRPHNARLKKLLCELYGDDFLTSSKTNTFTWL